MSKGIYDPEKAKTLWKYHADRAAHSYAKTHGDGTLWQMMFTTDHRKQATAHWEELHGNELHEGIDFPTIAELLAEDELQEELQTELENSGFSKESQETLSDIFVKAVIKEGVKNDPFRQRIQEILNEYSTRLKRQIIAAWALKGLPRTAQLSLYESCLVIGDLGGTFRI
jgi:hypothetical protein